MVGSTGRPRPPGPDIPADIEVRDLDREVRAELRALPKGAADTVARHLVAAGRFIDSDPALALEHAQAARSQAARVASVREAVGIAAYHAGEWKLAIAELRAWKRFTGSDAHLAVIADSERALGRPEKAIELATSPEAGRLDTETRVELLIVASGAHQDQGDLDGALATLDVPELRASRPAPWVARLRYAYAELLLAAGRSDEAREWFVQAADADPDGDTDADERVLDLDGFQFTDEGDESSEEDEDTVDTFADEAPDDPDDAGDLDDEDDPDDEDDFDDADGDDDWDDDEDVAESPTDEELAVAGGADGDSAAVRDGTGGADGSTGSAGTGPAPGPRPAVAGSTASAADDDEKHDGGDRTAG